MLGTVKANGNLFTTSNATSLETRHADLGLQFDFVKPFGEKFEVFLQPGVGLLFSSTTQKIGNQSSDYQYTTIGYIVGAGIRFKTSEKIALNLQFDFSDKYGNAESWFGDLGILYLGLNYSF